MFQNNARSHDSLENLFIDIWASDNRSHEIVRTYTDSSIGTCL